MEILEVRSPQTMVPTTPTAPSPAPSAPSPCPSSVSSISLPQTPTTSKKKETFRDVHFNFCSKSGYTCKDCGASYVKSISGNTLKKHVEKFHEKKDQRSVADFFSSKSAPRKSFLDAVVDWIIDDARPFAIVSTDSFRNMIRASNPETEVPDRKKVADEAKKRLGKLQGQMISLVKSRQSKVALTTDIWTSIANKSYVAVTGHFIGTDGAIVHTLLDFQFFPHPHAGPDINNILQCVVLDFKLKDKVAAITTDNASNNITMMEYLERTTGTIGVSHVRCMPHILHLVVTSGLTVIKTIVDKARSLSKSLRVKSRTQTLKETAKKLGKPYHAPTIDVETRWGSTWLMIDRLLSMRSVVKYLIETDPDFKNLGTDEETWGTLTNLGPLLKPFVEATELLSGSKYVSLSLVIPVAEFLVKDLEVAMEVLGDDLGAAAEAMKDKIEDYLPHIRSKTHELATLLDPRFNQSFFKEINYKNYEKITDCLRGLIDLSPNMPQETRSSNFSDRMFKRVRATNEIDEYIAMTQLPRDVNPLDWWKLQKGHLPQLSKLAYDTLCIPGSSVKCEQVFSQAGETISRKRGRLDDESIRCLMCIRHWNKVLAN